jgi:hypothetical protein
MAAILAQVENLKKTRYGAAMKSGLTEAGTRRTPAAKAAAA